MTWERARQPEQIEHRRREILAAAAALFAEQGLDGASLTAIAKAAGISKANVYRYFESREAIFLELLAQDMAAWVRDLERGLATLAGSDNADAFVDVFVDLTASHERLLALVGDLSSVLERNISAEAVREFKREYIALSTRIVNASHAALPSLSLADAQRFYAFTTGFAMGAFPSSQPPPHVAEVLAEPEFAVLRHDFGEMLRDHARVVLRGLLAGD